jgi:O-acetyl-ADP-ribose deacetylase (regulator of RNase III)
VQIILAAIEEDLASAWQRFCGDLPGVRIHSGSILDLDCDAVVSPANSFGFMDGGIDAAYARHFGEIVPHRLQKAIRERHHGELLIGAAEIVETDHARIPHLIATPTMRVPMVLRDSINPYLAARAVFLLIEHGTHSTGRPLRQVIQTVAFPGLGTGVGRVSPSTCAHQMRAAIDHFVLGNLEPPRNWAEASEGHQLLYSDQVRRLQHE